MAPVSKGDSHIIQGVQGALGLGREELTGVGGRMVNKFKGLFYWFFFHGRQCDPPLYLFPETCSGIYITHWRFGNGNCARRGLTRGGPGVEGQTQGVGLESRPLCGIRSHVFSVPQGSHLAPARPHPTSARDLTGMLGTQIL